MVNTKNRLKSVVPGLQFWLVILYSGHFLHYLTYLQFIHLPFASIPIVFGTIPNLLPVNPTCGVSTRCCSASPSHLVNIMTLTVSDFCWPICVYIIIYIHIHVTCIVWKSHRLHLATGNVVIDPISSEWAIFPFSCQYPYMVIWFNHGCPWKNSGVTIFLSAFYSKYPPNKKTGVKNWIFAWFGFRSKKVSTPLWMAYNEKSY